MHLQTKIEKFGVVNVESKNEMSRFQIEFYDSSSTETVGNRGVSHLVEHLMCKSFDDMLDTIQEHGITYNACTGSNKMYFWFTGLDKYINKFKYELYDRITNYEISKEDFEKEKLIVLQEFTDAFTDQGTAHYINVYRKYFNDYTPIGDYDDIKDISYEDFLEFKKERFTIPNRILNISKNSPFVLPEGASTTDECKEDRSVLDVEDNRIIEAPYFDKNVSIINFTNMIEHDEENSAKIDFLCKFYCHGLNSPLYQEIREKRGYVYGLSFDVFDVSSEQFSIGLFTTTIPENVDDLNKVFFDVIEDDSYITQERLDQIYNGLVIEEEIADIQNYTCAGLYVSENKNIYVAKESVTLEEMKRLHEKYFKRENFTLSTDRSI